MSSKIIKIIDLVFPYEISKILLMLYTIVELYRFNPTTKDVHPISA